MYRKTVTLVLLGILCLGNTSKAQTEEPEADSSAVAAILKPEPFAFGDFTWLNGNDRRHKTPLQSKYFTGSVMVDVNYNYSDHNPIDHTVVGSTILARENEVQLAYVGLGGDFHYDNMHAHIMTQFGTRSTVVPRNDYSPYRGQYNLADVYRYLSEAYAGYHWNKWNGINLDMGMFMSYIGLFSYYSCENWATQPSFTSDNTPWFFNGARLQMYPSDRIKVELWAINGWQSYGMFNEMPGFGGQFLWRPTEYMSMCSNNYFGTDAAGNPAQTRFHTDNSFLLRYYNVPGKRGLSRAAFSATCDFGFENGGGVSAFGGAKGPAANFLSGMIYHRMWFNDNHLGWTVGGGFIHNPSRYLVLLPTGDASALPNQYNPTQPAGTHPFTANPGDQFDGWDCSTTFDWMPNDFLTWRFEVVHREASVDYFAGRGGVTSPTGYTTTAAPGNWAPDLVKSESRVIINLLVRL